MEIRNATLGDAAAIAALYKDQFRVMAALEPYSCQEGAQSSEFIEGCITGSDSAVFVAEEGGAIVGFVLLQEKEPMPFDFKVPRRYALLLDIHVSEHTRGKGVGGALMRAAEDWARERGLDYIELGVLSGNARAIAVYEKNGYADIMHHMRKIL